MKPHSPTVLLITVLALALAASVLVVQDAAFRSQPGEEAREFQRLVGGLGFGPAVDLSRCAFSFDPRLCPACPEDDGPIPGGGYFCPRHGFSVFFYPSLPSPDASP